MPDRTGIFLGGRAVNINNCDPYAYAKTLLDRGLPDPMQKGSANHRSKNLTRLLADDRFPSKSLVAWSHGFAG